MNRLHYLLPAVAYLAVKYPDRIEFRKLHRICISSRRRGKCKKWRDKVLLRMSRERESMAHV